MYITGFEEIRYLLRSRASCPHGSIFVFPLSLNIGTHSFYLLIGALFSSRHTIFHREPALLSEVYLENVKAFFNIVGTLLNETNHIPIPNTDRFFQILEIATKLVIFVMSRVVTSFLPFKLSHALFPRPASLPLLICTSGFPKVSVCCCSEIHSVVQRV